MAQSTERNRTSLHCWLWGRDRIVSANRVSYNLWEAGTLRSPAERGTEMRDEFKVEHSHPKSRPPTTVRIEVDLVSRKITAVWELLQITKPMAFSLQRFSGNDDLDVFAAAKIAQTAIERDNPPFRFVDGERLEVWQILSDGEIRLVATAVVSVASLYVASVN
jgi:hypothetical protein